MAVDRFVKILVKHKIVTKEQVLDADKLAKKKNIKLAEALVELEYATEEQVCLLYTSPSPRDQRGSRMPSSA